MPFDQAPIQGYNGWNLNQAYMTPAYMANFRPSYNQGEVYNPYAQHHSIGQSLWQGVGPGRIHYGGDPLQYSGAHAQNLATTPYDAAMQGLQSVAIPLASWYAADRMIGKTGLGSAMGRGAARAGFGAAGGMIGRLPMMGGIGAGIGRLGASALVGGAAGLAGGMMLPIIAGQALASGMNAAFVDPYVATRRGMDAMRANTANTFISGSGGSTSGGFGMSAVRAQQISQALTVAGQQDFSLTGSDYNQVADNMMRAGIFQEVGDMDATRIVDGVKKATSVLKMISRITGDPDIQNGIQTLATLKAGGLDDIDKMGQALTQIRAASAASGTSVNQILDTIGNQGMVMAQQYGMRGVTGLLASADAYAGFTNARRAGLISGAQMGALGGAEGMTQNALSGQMQALSSPYARMIMQGGGMAGGGIASNIAQWGGVFSSNPMAMSGDWFINQSAYMDQMMSGGMANENTMRILQDYARATNQNPGDALVLANIAQSMGLNPQQTRSIFSQYQAGRDPRAGIMRGESYMTAQTADIASRREQEGLTFIGTRGLGDAQVLWKNVSRGFKGASANVTNPFTSTAAEVTDWWEGITARAKGLTLEHNRRTYADGNLVGIKGFKATTFSGQSGYWGAPGGSSTQLSESSKHNQLIAKLQTASNAPGVPPRVKDMMARAMKALADGDYKTATDIIARVDQESKGFFSGSKLAYEQEDFRADLLQKFESGELQVTVDKAAGSTVDTGTGAFSDAMRKGESGAAGYSALYGGWRTQRFDPTQLSVQEVLQRQQIERRAGGKSSAVGKYQFIYKTLKEQVEQGIREGWLDPNQKFDEATQDKLAMRYAMTKPNIKAYVESPNPTPEMEQAAMNDMAEIWASFPMASGPGKGRSRYAGDGLNKAHLSLGESRAAIQDLRTVQRGGAPASSRSIKDRIAIATLGSTDQADKEALVKLFSGDMLNSEDAWRELGLDPAAMKGMTDTQKQGAMVKAALSQKGGKRKGLSGEADLVSRLESRGVSSKQFYNYLSRTGDDVKAIMREIDSAPNVQEGIDAVARNINNEAGGAPKSAPAGDAEVDFSQVRDIGQATAGLGMTMQSTNKELKRLNDYLEAPKPETKGWSFFSQKGEKVE